MRGNPLIFRCYARNPTIKGIRNEMHPISKEKKGNITPLGRREDKLSRLRKLNAFFFCRKRNESFKGEFGEHGGEIPSPEFPPRIQRGILPSRPQIPAPELGPKMPVQTSDLSKVTDAFSTLRGGPRHLAIVGPGPPAWSL